MTAQLRGRTLDKNVALQHVANPHGVQVQPSYVTAHLRGLTSHKYVALQHVATPHGVQVQPSYVSLR